jgi:hypothetical protein
MWKKIFLITFCVAGGLVLGVAIGKEFPTAKFFRTMFFMQEKEIYDLGQAAQNAYFYEPNEVAIWAMTTYLKRLDNVEKERNIARRDYAVLSRLDKEIALVRLGRLYTMVGEPNKAQEQFNLAIQYHKEECPDSPKTQEELLEFVKKVDEQALKHREAGE